MLTRRKAIGLIAAIPFAGVAVSPRKCEAYELIHVSTGMVTVIDVNGKPFHSLDKKGDVWYFGRKEVSIFPNSSKKEVDAFIQRHQEEQGPDWIIRVIYNPQLNKYGVFALHK